MDAHTFEVEEKDVPAMLIAGVRMMCRYSDCGKGFALIGRKLGRHLCGKPFNLYYDACFREGDADLEACVPMKRQAEAAGISVRELSGEHCVTLLHQGPYDTLTASYEKVRAYIDAKGYTAKVPSREVYHKGPGMIFRGNPKKYLTEIQIPVA